MIKKYIQTAISLAISLAYYLFAFFVMKSSEYTNIAFSLIAIITAGICLPLIITSLTLILSRPKKYKSYWVYNFTGIFLISISILLIIANYYSDPKLNYAQLFPCFVLLFLGCGVILDIFIFKSPIL